VQRDISDRRRLLSAVPPSGVVTADRCGQFRELFRFVLAMGEHPGVRTFGFLFVPVASYEEWVWGCTVTGFLSNDTEHLVRKRHGFRSSECVGLGLLVT
jgi:hypothetical protein